MQELNKTPERIAAPIKYRMIITMSQYNTVITRHVRNELEQMGYLVLKCEMYHRVAYPKAAIKGLSPCITTPYSAAAQDISTITTEITNILQ